MKLTLIRHAQTKFEPKVNSLLWKLTEEGENSARQLSNSFYVKSVDVIYSSFQTKALQTSLILAKDNHIPIVPNNDLTELTSITNKFITNYEQTVQDFYEGKVDRINDGETIDECSNRFNNVINKIISENTKVSNIGIVSHGNALAIFSSQFCDKNAYELHNLIKMPDFAILDWNSKKFEVFWNSTY